MRLNTDPKQMLQAAETIASGYSEDRNVLGVLIRQPVPDDPDFPQTCDVELALVIDDPALATQKGYFLSRRRSGDVLIDVCAIDKQWLLDSNTNPLTWILSLGDPRAFDVLRDQSGGQLTRLFPAFKRLYLETAVLRVPFWLAEAKRRLDAATNSKLDPILRIPEAEFALVYVTCALLDSSGRSYAGSFLKLPRNLGWVSPQLEEELRENLPSADKDPRETAGMIPSLVSELASECPPISQLDPKGAAETQYNLSPLEAAYRSFVAGEIAKKDPITGLWYARAWGTYLVFHYGAVAGKVTGNYKIPSPAFATWEAIQGKPNAVSIETFVGWVEEVYGLCVEACEEVGVLKDTRESTSPASA